MPTDDLTFCEHCNDSGDVEAEVQYPSAFTQYLPCPRCPRCEICDMRAYLGAQGGKVGDDWACSPEHAAAIITGSMCYENCEPLDLYEAADRLRWLEYDRTEGKEFSPRDYMLLARACSLMADSIVQDAHRLTEPASIAEGTLTDFTRILLEGKA